MFLHVGLPGSSPVFEVTNPIKTMTTVMTTRRYHGALMGLIVESCSHAERHIHARSFDLAIVAVDSGLCTLHVIHVGLYV